MKSALSAAGGLLVITTFLAIGIIAGILYRLPLTSAPSPHGEPNSLGNLPYSQGSLDAERMMQITAVKNGVAHWEGENGEFFVWSNPWPNTGMQRFHRIRDQYPLP